MNEANREGETKMAANAVVSAPKVPLEHVFEEHHDRVFRTAYRITGNANDAEDVLQTVFMRLLRQQWSPGSIDNVEAYLQRAAVNAALDVVRARRDSERVSLEDLSGVLQADGRLEPERLEQSAELGAILRKELALLPPKSAEMFALRYFEGYPNPEIARMFGTSAGAVSVTLHRTRAELEIKMRSHMETGHE